MTALWGNEGTAGRGAQAGGKTVESVAVVWAGKRPRLQDSALEFELVGGARPAACVGQRHERPLGAGRGAQQTSVGADGMRGGRQAEEAGGERECLLVFCCRHA